MPPRFYCPTLTAPGSALLAETEAHHLSHVLRLAVGEPIELFNGQGLSGEAVVREIRKREILCDVAGVSQEQPSLPEMTLATAVPKGERFDWLVEKATELGVSRLVPLITTRSMVDPRDAKLTRLRQTVIAACKQCRRSQLMELSAPMTWSDFLRGRGEQPLIVAHPAGTPISQLAPAVFGAGAPRTCLVAVGPEGGFTDEEIAAGRAAGGRIVSLGTRTLRIETAGLALAAWGLVQQTTGESR